MNDLLHVRVSEAPRYLARFRITTTPRAVEQVTVEYAGQLGHPSSYGLLGGSRADAQSIDVPTGGRYNDSLAGRLDEVKFGLLDEYRLAVESGLGDAPVAVSVAAHGAFGSSCNLFRQLAQLLAALVIHGVPADDDDLWRLWENTAVHTP